LLSLYLPILYTIINTIISGKKQQTGSNEYAPFVQFALLRILFISKWGRDRKLRRSRGIGRKHLITELIIERPQSINMYLRATIRFMNHPLSIHHEHIIIVIDLDEREHVIHHSLDNNIYMNCT